MRELIVGDIIVIKEDLLGNDQGAFGLVVGIEIKEKQERFISVIFENGEIDIFSPHEQHYFFSRVGHIKNLSSYRFKSSSEVQDDYNDGKFSEVFE